jgi:GPI ethanolamine phosphate transferase 3 subunit O
LILDNKSECAVPPVNLTDNYVSGSVERGCWHPKSFDKAVIIIVDALRYDFTVPFRASTSKDVPNHFHNVLPLFYDTVVKKPENSFLLPFIADPPTTTLQRLKGLTTGTLPTLLDAGSNFAGTAITEDNLVAQLFNAGKNIVHLGDDTWHSLFPGYFDSNLTRAYDSFNVWDLHTVDNGVNEHLFPLLNRLTASRWDGIFGHYLGIDHAGHRYGPDHPAMNAKLNEMNDVFTKVIDAIDDQTLLVVMGDHGMDSKGDHGGESDDEVEAALWMYAKRPLFGRTHEAYKQPPSNAKERSVRQIDLVPTLSLLLGMPIPFNNLGKPIDEAFVGKSGSDFSNLAKVNRLTAAQIHRYQNGYAAARKLDTSATSPVDDLWNSANHAWAGAMQMRFPPLDMWRAAFWAFSRYERENLNVCRSLWARFDNVRIICGIEVLALSFVLLCVFVRGFTDNRADLTRSLLIHGFGGLATGVAAGIAFSQILKTTLLGSVAYCASICSIIGVGFVFASVRQKLRLPIPRTFWAWTCVTITLLLCTGFAANSFTIWEDEILLFFLCTFGVLMLLLSLRQEDSSNRSYGAMQSISFIIFTRVSSLSRLCREEQMPYCKSTYYASANTSTSSWWQLAVPFVMTLLMPTAVRNFYERSKDYHGFAAFCVGVAFRIGLLLTAMYWLLDAADDNGWLPGVSSASLKTTRVAIAQVIIGIAFAAGYATWIWAPPWTAVEKERVEAAPAVVNSEVFGPSNPTSQIFITASEPEAAHPELILMGYANTFGTRYFLLPLSWALAFILLQKPIGQGTLSLCLLSILSLLDILDANNLQSSPLGSTLLALLGGFYFFKTGHQATVASIQWESAFIPLKSVTYPWSPLFVVLNSFGPQLLCALAVPATVLWKVPLRRGTLINDLAIAMGTHFLFYQTVTLATVVEASWLRRHLMLYRVFMPRMMLAVMVGTLVQIWGAFIALEGVKRSVLSKVPG